MTKACIKTKFNYWDIIYFLMDNEIRKWGIFELWFETKWYTKKDDLTEIEIEVRYRISVNSKTSDDERDCIKWKNEEDIYNSVWDILEKLIKLNNDW